jgi:hypothetical protein
MTDTRSATATTTPRFSAELFAAFWAAPDMSRGMDILAEDIVGYWPGDTEPVRGFTAYTCWPSLRTCAWNSSTAPRLPAPSTARNCSSCTMSGTRPDRTGRSRSVGWTGFAPATAWWWRT